MDEGCATLHTDLLERESERNVSYENSAVGACAYAYAFAGGCVHDTTCAYFYLKILRVVVTVVVISGSKVAIVKKMNDWPIAEHRPHLPTMIARSGLATCGLGCERGRVCVGGCGCKYGHGREQGCTS